ncbi:MFS polyamine transporter [Pleurotus eryngii]|uniref:MFS polyamine transporter n=1 Tax=Pleurotus eryngii TaxID=5323 RepID=A0A9P6DA89_PLEER|nr:MFS polyamine transporter [Pleurotus eryngii]
MTENSKSDEQERQSDVLIVDWDGPDDPLNPKNWSYKNKWAATIVVSSFTFISPVSSSMIAPAAEALSRDFGITNTVVTALTVSVFVLAYTIGPLFLGPLSEIFGRSRVLQLANLFYLAWNIGCGFAQNTGQLIAFRFLAGLGGSAPFSIGGGVISDTWETHERGRAIAIYSLAPLLGPVIGPVAGAWIAEKSTWRWVFWSTSIVCVAIQISGLFFLRETYAPVLLEQKAEKLRKTMDSENGAYKEVRTIYESPDRTWQSIMIRSLTRPFMLFFSEPIIQVLGVYMAFIYGVFYLFLTTMPLIFEGTYHQRPGIAGLHYIAIGIGLTGASQFNALAMDRIYAYLKKRNGDNGRPEYRLPPMVPGTFLLPAGLLINGWSAQNHVHWIVPDIGTALIGAGLILNFQSIQIYVVDTFSLHAASALAAASFLRSVAGFGFPLFAPEMYKALGYGKGDTILAAVAIAIGCPAPFLFWRYGEQIRCASRYARKPSSGVPPIH